MDDFLNDLLSEFLIDSFEMIESIENPLLELENGNDISENINSIFRAFHSVKGGAGMFKLEEITRLAHSLENRLDHYRKTQEDITESDIATFLTGSDLLKFMLKAVQDDMNEPKKVLAQYTNDVENILKNFTEDLQDENSEENNETLESFKLEATENITVVEETLINLEENRKENELLNTIFRCIHTIKGTADYIGLKNIRTITHEFESLLDSMRSKTEIEISDTQFDLLLESTDLVRELIENGDALETEERKDQEIIKRLKKETKKFLSGNIEPQEIEDCPEINDVESDEKESELQKDHIKNVVLIQALKQQARNLKIQISKCKKDDIDIKQSSHGIRRSLANISKIAKNNSCATLLTESENIQNVTSEIMLETLNKEQIISEIQNFYEFLLEFISLNSKETPSKNKFESSTSNEKRTTPPKKDDKDEKSADTKTTKTAKAVQSTFRIDQSVADDLTNLVGELTVAKNSLIHLHTGIASSNETTQKESIVLLQKLSNHINQLTNELNDNVMKMRMVPVKNVFQKFPRLVRDLSKKVNKKVKLEIEGEETEVDKTIIEGLADPLVHMIRNSLDHGIETKEERAKSNKNETAIIKLRALNQGSKIVIELIDDGRGINTDRVLEKAIKNKLITHEQSLNLTHNEIVNYIMMPGFSTAETVTDLSGRGVGMDVVKSNIEGLKGSIRIQSEYNVGTTFRLELPLTMSIVDALLVENSDKIYALSLENIIETVKIKKEDYISVMNTKCISLRGNVIGVEYLSQLMSGKIKKIEDNELKTDELTTVVILKYDNKTVGVIVDRVLRNQEIVLKTLPSIYSKEKILSGASILGDGRAVLVLNTETIFTQITAN